MPPDDPREIALRLEQLRSRRVRPERDTSLTAQIAGQRRELERTRRRIGAISGAWIEVCPPDLLERTAVKGLNRGVLTIAVADAPTRYELSRLLREGAERELIRRAPTTIRRVKLVPGAIEPDAP